VRKGGFLTIFGPNGAGKTTLLKILSTITSPTSGQVRIAGLPIYEDSLSVRRKVGLISHNPLLYGDLTAYENLQFYGALYNIQRAEERIEELLEKVELSHRRFDLVRTFSRGMLQRLAIARVLLHEPEILFLDEPHAGLDPHAVDILDGLLANIREDHTFIMVTHNLDKGLEMATSVMILVDGEIIYQQSRRELDLKTLKDIYRQKVKCE
jgi:heme exporter protein A